LTYKIPKDKARLFFQLLYDSGCRIGELAKINKKDIDFNERTIMIYGKGGYMRKIKFEKTTTDILKHQYNKLNINDTLFKWNVGTMKRYFKDIARLVFGKDTKISPHWFRHSRATHLAIVWNDIIKLKDYMGWSDIKMAEVYVANLTMLSSDIKKYKSTDLWKDLTKIM